MEEEEQKNKTTANLLQGEFTENKTSIEMEKSKKIHALQKKYEEL